MSGGYFEYQDSTLDNLADAIDDAIATNDDVSGGKWSEIFGYKSEGLHASEKALGYMRRMAEDLRRLGKLLHSFDWYVCADTSEEDFIEDAERLYGEKLYGENDD